MNKKLSELYSMYESQEISLNQKVIQTLGLCVEDIFFKVGNLKIPGIIYSTSMTFCKFIVRLDDKITLELKKHHFILSLRYSFRTASKSHKISFFVPARVLAYDKYSIETPDLYIMSLEFINRAPDDLILKLGEYLNESRARQKRSESRFVLNSNSKERLGLKQMENFLFSEGKGKKCYLTEISIFSAKVLIKGNKGEFSPGQHTMLIMKSEVLKGLGEMVGEVKRVEPINSKEGLFAVVILFDQNLIPPIYKMWVAQCIESIKIKAELY